MTLIDDIRSIIEPELKLFEDAYRSALNTDNPLLSSVFEHLSIGKGKQLRPVITLLSAKLCRGITDKTISSAVALELIHTASLIHDDIVDMSDMRRGQASVNAQWNNKVAVLTGDYLLSQSLDIISSIRNQSILNIVLNMARQLASGELYELHYGQSMWISEEEYYNIIEHKTAMLFEACTEVGAVSAAATPKHQRAMRAFGNCMGMCFQLKDDELDYSDNDDLGKPRMSDIRDGKVTLPLIIALKRAAKNEVEHIKEICRQPITYDTEQELKSFVLRYDGMRYARQKMEEYRAQARDIISVFHSSTAKEALLELLNYSINRLY